MRRGGHTVQDDLRSGDQTHDKAGRAQIAHVLGVEHDATTAGDDQARCAASS